MIKKVQLEQVSDLFPDGIALYLGMASFEARCLSILGALQTPPAHCLLFKNSTSGSLAEMNLERMAKLALNRNTIIDLDLDSPIASADAFAKAITSEDVAPTAGVIFIDTTTFTHEQLLILLRVLDQVRPKRKIFMGYTGAKEYSTNTDIKDVWLSRGISQIRSVLGYPGSFAPSKKLHLIILVGFEHERSASIIEQFEPARLTLGVGGPSVSPSHYATNQRFFDSLKIFVERTQLTQTAVETFKFSCIDPFNARDAVIEQANKDSGFNVVVCPMNTKISTVGVGMAAIQDERIQIAYARAIEYNESGYSTPSTMATIFEYPSEHREFLNEVKVVIKPPSVLPMTHGVGNLPT